MTNLLATKPVWLDAEAGKEVVGIDLEGEGAGKTEAKFGCGALVGEIVVTGSVLAEVLKENAKKETQVNKELGSLELGLACEAGKLTKQKWTTYEEPFKTLIKDELLTSVKGEAAQASCEQEVTPDVITLEPAGTKIEIKT